MNKYSNHCCGLRLHLPNPDRPPLLPSLVVWEATPPTSCAVAVLSEALEEERAPEREADWAV